MTKTIETDWRSQVVRADPDWNRNRRWVTEYEFTARRAGDDERTHEGQKRIFKGNYDTRGPYSAALVAAIAGSLDFSNPDHSGYVALLEDI